MDVFQVDERGFYVRLVCNKGQGVAVSLFRALESLISFNVQSSNLATSADNFVLTFTLHVSIPLIKHIRLLQFTQFSFLLVMNK